MAEWAGEVGRAAATGGDTPEGLVRITASPTPASTSWPRARPGSRRATPRSGSKCCRRRGTWTGPAARPIALRLRRPPGKDLEVIETIEYDNAARVSSAL